MNSAERRAYARNMTASRSGWTLVHDRCTDRWYLQGLSWRSDVERTLNGWRERAWPRLGQPAGNRRYWNIPVTGRMSWSQPATQNIPYGTPEERERTRAMLRVIRGTPPERICVGLEDVPLLDHGPLVTEDEILRRIADYREHPETSIPWEAIDIRDDVP